ncbi:MAG: hypothetical protein Q4C41_03635 [Eggerthellaceae bacterium]|nr:hypothetical protein [Eggerthellaceae bacterium]
MPAEIAGLVVLLSAFPAEIIYIYATTRVLRMSHVAVFWALRLSLMLAITLTRASFPELAPWMSLFAGVGMYALLPLVMSKGRLTYRVFVVLALFLLVSIADIVTTAFWFLIAGVPLPSGPELYAVLPEFLVSRLVHLLVVALLMGVFCVGMRRLSGGERHHGVRAVMPLLVVQVALIALTISTWQYYDGNKAGIGAVALALGLACLVVDAYLLSAIERFEQQRLSRERARMLEGQLDDYLGRYAAVAESVGRVAQLRHDARNQLQVVSDLAARGERDQARSMLAALIARCEEAGDDLGKVEGAQ